MSEVRAKKALGQHFLVDLNIARKICDSLSGGDIRLRTAPVVAALPGADVFDFDYVFVSVHIISFSLK